MTNEDIEALPVVFEVTVHLRDVKDQGYASSITDIKGESDLPRMMTAALTLVKAIALVERKSAQDVLMDLLEAVPHVTTTVVE